MTLSVIGAGFGRTGTMSLKLALEQLGLGPCFHMFEIVKNPALAERWVHADDGGPMDWNSILKGYRSTVDWPSCDYWRELAAYAPEARIILTVRDAEGWFNSTQQTIFSAANTIMASDPSPIGQIMRAISTRNFGGAHHDRERCIAAYERHNDEVRQTVPADRLLVFNVAEGWEPLCRFLGHPVPATPFPMTNSTDEFRQRAAAMMPARAEAPGQPA